MTTHLCISTQNQAANLLPALQLKADGMILLSSSVADEGGWTGNMKRVCDRRGLPLRIVPIPADAEDAAERMARAVEPHLPDKDTPIFWNMTGGKKSMTLGILSLFLRRGADADRLIYTDNRPHRIVFYDQSLARVDETPMDFFMELEDLLNLNGFSAKGTGTRLSEAVFEDWVSPFVEAYRSDPLFQELVVRAMDQKPPELNTREKMKTQVRKLLHDHRPRYERLFESVSGLDDQALGNLRKALRSLPASPGKADLDPILRHWNDFFWRTAKDRLVPELVENLRVPSEALFAPPLPAKQAERLERKMKATGLSFRETGRGFTRGNISFPHPHGKVFEIVVARFFQETLVRNGLERFLPHVFLNTNTFALSEKDVQADEDEIDVAVVTPWGSFFVFEVKVYIGEGGDVVRRRRDTARTKSGIFGRAIFVDPLLGCRRNARGDFEHFFPSGLVENHRQIEASQGLQAWCFDEIGTRLPGLLAPDRTGG